MYDRDSAALIRSTPALKGLDAMPLHDLLTETLCAGRRKQESAGVNLKEQEAAYGIRSVKQQSGQSSLVSFRLAAAVAPSRVPCTPSTADRCAH